MRAGERNLGCATVSSDYLLEVSSQSQGSLPVAGGTIPGERLTRRYLCDEFEQLGRIVRAELGIVFGLFAKVRQSSLTILGLLTTVGPSIYKIRPRLCDRRHFVVKSPGGELESFRPIVQKKILKGAE